MKNKIKEIRSKNRVSQKQLAAALSLNQSQVSKIENNKRALKNDEVLKIAQFLNVKINEIFCKE